MAVKWSAAKKLVLPGFLGGLSFRLLILTIFFVMLAEFFIYAPSIGRFRLVYLEERLASASLAILALQAAPENMVSDDMERDLMSHVGAYSAALSRPGAGRLMLMIEYPQVVPTTYDLRKASFFGLIRDAFVTLLIDEDRLIRVIGPAPMEPGALLEIVMEEAPLRTEMLEFSKRILALSLIISIFTAALVYLSLHLLMVRPMRRMTASMVAFREDPENASQSQRTSGRRDEIGLAQRELGVMQSELRAALLQKTRLAALGTAVTKINHDLRNILATASLVSDSLAQSDHPDVRRITPRLVAALDRAVNLCTQTLNFTREGPALLDVSRFALHGLVTEVLDSLPSSLGDPVPLENRIPANLEIAADREQLFRVFNNLISNSVQAGATMIKLSCREENGVLRLDLSDNGPGLPPRARENLFQPFSGSARKGGTGLGLAIARDLMRAHGGEIVLVSSDGEGTHFCLTLPIQAGQITSAKSA